MIAAAYNQVRFAIVFDEPLSYMIANSLLFAVQI